MANIFILGLAVVILGWEVDSSTLFWKTIGVTGVLVFGSRFVIQWIYSEKHKESRIPTIFWWQSIVGTILCSAYFIHQREWVGILGYVPNLIPYTRNLVLVYRKKRQDQQSPATLEQ